MNNDSVNSSDALRGTEALMALRDREVCGPSSDLFARIVNAATQETRQQPGKQRFWLGTGFGGAIAASLFALALTLGWFDGLQNSAPTTAEFVLALNEPRLMDLAFETDRQLQGATISILLSGDVELDGYGSQREVTWAENLDAGVNRLSLPVFANGLQGGQMVVRLSHPDSEQVFVINLPTES